jgi:GNAT superfamily N-acetyltransferase
VSGPGTQRESLRVRPAGHADVARLAAVLAAAFQDDPGFIWCAPDPVRRQRHGQRYFELLLSRVYLPKDEVRATEDLRAVALWSPPGRWENPPSGLLALLPVLVASTGRHLVRTLRGTAAMERVHRTHTRPHRYLALMAVDPAVQGSGRGTALLRHTLARCDADGTPTYLEATSPRNRDLYRRHSFEVLDEQHWPGGGPPWWSMWREPQPAAARSPR